VTNRVIDALDERFDRGEHRREVVTIAAGVVEGSSIELAVNQNVARERELDVRGTGRLGRRGGLGLGRQSGVRAVDGTEFDRSRDRGVL
jgi:hypothetical protein